jgi:hypothetical protein
MNDLGGEIWQNNSVLVFSISIYTAAVSPMTQYLAMQFGSGSSCSFTPLPTHLQSLRRAIFGTTGGLAQDVKYTKIQSRFNQHVQPPRVKHHWPVFSSPGDSPTRRGAQQNKESTPRTNRKCWRALSAADVVLGEFGRRIRLDDRPKCVIDRNNTEVQPGSMELLLAIVLNPGNPVLAICWLMVSLSFLGRSLTSL